MRVLVLGRNLPELDLATRRAAADGAEIRYAASLEIALDQLRSGCGADLLLVDVQDDVAGILATLEAERFHLPLIAYGIAAEPRAAVAAIRAGAREFLPLPPDPDLIAAIFAAIGGEQKDLVSADPRMQSVLDLARRFAPTDACVMITGESGTGKEMMARFLHSHSRRVGRPMIAVNCAAIPDNLLESELFGHEKGAFTGAQARRIGKFEEANGGTLLLDEITEMDPRLQAKLLRAIQEKEIDRVGGTRPVKVDIRLIATSNRELLKAVADGSFREDLLFRLSVLTLELPPLRERPQDVLALARHFAGTLAESNGLPPRALTDAALGRLTGQPWRGNVRELQNCIHRAVILARGSRIEAEDICLPQAGGKVAAPAASVPGAIAGPMLVGRTVAEVERNLIIDTLRHTSGNRTHAATVLGISIRTLRNKLKQYSDEGVAVPPVAAEFAA